MKRSDFADVTVETNTFPKMRASLEALAQRLGATVTTCLAVCALTGAGFDSVAVNDIDFDENPSVVTNVTFDGLITEHQPLTNYYSKAETDAKIVELAPAPGNYSVVSNRAMTALQSYTETDPTIYSWAKDPSKPSYAYSEIAGVPTTWAWSDITGKPTTWAWSSVTGKPSWIGSSKPSYAYSEITGKPIIPDMQADGTMVVASTNAWSSDIAGFTPGDGSLRPPALFVQHSEPDGGGTHGYTTLGATNYWAGLTFDGIHYDVMTGGDIISTGSLMFTNIATKADHYTKAATDQRIAELAPNPSNVVTQAYIRDRLGIYLYIGEDGRCYVHVPE